MNEEFHEQEAPERQQEQSVINVRDIVNTLFKRKYTIFIVFVVALLLAVAGYFFQLKTVKPQYEAYSTIMIKFGREYMKEELYRPDLSEAGGEGSPFNRGKIIGSEIQILLSRKVKEEVITTIGVENLYPLLIESSPQEISTLDIALSIFEENLVANPLRGSDVVRVFFTHQNPETASKVVNLLIDIYQVKRLEILTDPRSITFLKQTVDQYHQKLMESEENLSNYKKKYNLYSFDDQKSSLLEQKASLNIALKETRNRLDELRQTLSFFENQIIETPKLLTVPTEEYQSENTVMPRLEARLLDLKVKENELLQKFKETNTWVVNVREEMRSIKELIEKEQIKTQSEDSSQSQARTVLGVNPAYQQMEIDIIKNKFELKALEVKEKNLLRQLKQGDQDLRDFYLLDKQYKKLGHELSESEKNYQVLYKRYETASISEQMEQQKMTGITVIEKATPPIKPVKGHKGIILFIAGGAGFGLAAGAGLTVLLEIISKVVSTPEKAEKVLGLPVLVTVPYEKMER